MCVLVRQTLLVSDDLLLCRNRREPLGTQIFESLLIAVLRRAPVGFRQHPASGRPSASSLLDPIINQVDNRE